MAEVIVESGTSTLACHSTLCHGTQFKKTTEERKGRGRVMQQSFAQTSLKHTRNTELTHNFPTEILKSCTVKYNTEQLKKVP